MLRVTKKSRNFLSEFFSLPTHISLSSLHRLLQPSEQGEGVDRDRVEWTTSKDKMYDDGRIVVVKTQPEKLIPRREWETVFRGNSKINCSLSHNHTFMSWVHPQSSPESFWFSRFCYWIVMIFVVTSLCPSNLLTYPTSPRIYRVICHAMYFLSNDCII